MHEQRRQPGHGRRPVVQCASSTPARFPAPGPAYLAVARAERRWTWPVQGPAPTSPAAYAPRARPPYRGPAALGMPAPSGTCTRAALAWATCPWSSAMMPWTTGSREASAQRACAACSPSMSVKTGADTAVPWEMARRPHRHDTSRAGTRVPPPVLAWWLDAAPAPAPSQSARQPRSAHKAMPGFAGVEPSHPAPPPTRCARGASARAARRLAPWSPSCL